MGKKIDLKFKLFKNLPLVYGISTLANGNMHLNFKNSQINRKEFLKLKQINRKKIFSAGLVHGTKVKSLNNSFAVKVVENTDALITSNLNSILSVTVADCFPVYFYSADKNKVGIAHAGWRGTLRGIVPKTVKSLGGEISKIYIAIGPGIQSCHFEIKKDILNKFKSYPKAITKKNNKYFVSLPEIIKNQLLEIGVRNIESFGECTFCESKKYFSYRRDKPESVQAMLAYIGMLPKTDGLL